MQIGQFILGKNLGIGAFGKVGLVSPCTAGRILDITGLHGGGLFTAQMVTLLYRIDC